MRKKTYSHVTKDKDGIIRAYYKHTGGYHEIDKTETMTNIKEINLSTGKWLAVEVPKEAEKLDVSIQPDNIPCLTYWYKENLDPTIISLPVGHTYTLIGKASELSWQDKVSIIEKEHDGSESLRWWYKLYPAEKGMEQWTRDPHESFETLLRAYGLNPETVIIIKQN